MIACLLQVAIESVILVVVMIAIGNVSWTFIWLPVIVVETMAFALGLGMIASVYNIVYRDVAYLVGIAMQILFYGTPIVYQLTDIPEKIGPIPVRQIVELSPLTQFTVQSRETMYLLRFPAWHWIAYTFAVSFLTLLFGWWVFSRKAADVIEEI